MSVISKDFRQNLEFMNDIIGDEIYLYVYNIKTMDKISMALTVYEIQMFRRNPKIISLLKKLNDEIKTTRRIEKV